MQKRKTKQTIQNQRKIIFHKIMMVLLEKFFVFCKYHIHTLSSKPFSRLKHAFCILCCLKHVLSVILFAGLLITTTQYNSSLLYNPYLQQFLNWLKSGQTLTVISIKSFSALNRSTRYESIKISIFKLLTSAPLQWRNFT